MPGSRVLAALVVSFGLAACQSALTEPQEAPAPTQPTTEGPRPIVLERTTTTGVDCSLIAATLTSLELGNYAPRRQRAAREAQLTTTCGEAGLTADDAKCLLTATKDSLAFCAKPLSVAHREKPAHAPMPESCTRYVESIERLATCSSFPEQSRQALLQATRQMETGFTQMTNNPEAMAAAGSACQQAFDAIRQAAQQMNCQL
jgi:hypothetical protein